MIKIKPGTRREQLDDKRISRNFFFFPHTFIIFEQRGKIYCHPLRFLHFREPLARRKACKTISNIYRREDELVFFAFSFSFYPFPGFPRKYVCSFVFRSLYIIISIQPLLSLTRGCFISSFSHLSR